MKSITAYGCSITAGVGIPQRGAWPNQLAHIMGIERVHNLGIPGADSSRILHEIMHTKSSGTVIIMWPGFDRNSIKHSKGWHHLLPAQDIAEQNQLNQLYYEHMYTPENHHWITHSHITLAHHHLNSLGCEQHHFTWEHHTPALEQPEWNPVTLHTVQFEYHRLPLASDGAHPGVEAHREVAHEMYQKISK